MSDRRDRSEIMALAAMYLDTTRCVGGHMVHSGYVCTWCNSRQPTGRSGYCAKEAIIAPETEFEDLPSIGRRKWKEEDRS
jgi:hypothetical protein